MPTGKVKRAESEADPLLTVRLPASLSLAIKNWAKHRGMNRSAAVRSLLELGLEADIGKPVRSSKSQRPRLDREGATTKPHDRVIGK